MAILTYGTSPRDFGLAALVCPAAGANGDSDILDRGMFRRAGLLSITSAIGATPTVTVNILGSIDPAFVSSWNIPYCAIATPETIAVAALVITTAVTTLYVLRPDHPWRFLLLRLTANTNVTITASVAA